MVGMLPGNKTCGGSAIFFALAVASSFGGCAPSEADVKQEFEAEVQSSNDCSQASECVVASAGCPLACFALVNAKFQARVEAKARQLIEDYESGGTGCDYECTPAPAIGCVSGKCAPGE